MPAPIDPTTGAGLQHPITATISKGPRAELRIGIADFGGRPRIFVRQFEADGRREMRPTGKLVVLDAEHVTALSAGLAAAAALMTDVAPNVPVSAQSVPVAPAPRRDRDIGQAGDASR